MSLLKSIINTVREHEGVDFKLVACMEAMNNMKLTPEQMHDLVEAIAEDHGKKLDREQFNDAALGMFEDISGFEDVAADHPQMKKYLKMLFQLYQQIK